MPTIASPAILPLAFSKKEIEFLHDEIEDIIRSYDYGHIKITEFKLGRLIEVKWSLRNGPSLSQINEARGLFREFEKRE